jgi:hypothetical protein
MTSSQDFLSGIEAFLLESGMSASVFGKLALNDSAFVKGLRDGRQPTLGVVDRVHAFIQSQRVSAD